MVGTDTAQTRLADNSGLLANPQSTSSVMQLELLLRSALVSGGLPVYSRDHAGHMGVDACTLSLSSTIM